MAWSQRFDAADGPPPPGHAVAARPGPVGARPERPERSKPRQKGVEKSCWAKVLGENDGSDVSDVYIIIVVVRQLVVSTQADF